MTEPIAVCWSGGKDSALALDELRRDQAYKIVALLTTVTSGLDRISMHGVRTDLLHRQAAALKVPVDEVAISPNAGNAEYEEQMGRALEGYRRRGIRRVAFGDIFLADLREYRERNLARAGLKGVFPLWKRDTRELADEFLKRGFRATVCCIDTSRLEDSFVGRTIDRDFFRDLPADVDPCGENGEFHSFTWGGPCFAGEIPIVRGETVRRGSFLFCDLLTP